MRGLRVDPTVSNPERVKVTRKNAPLCTCSTRGSISQNSTPQPPHSHLAVCKWSIAVAHSSANSSCASASSSSSEKASEESERPEGERDRLRAAAPAAVGDGDGESDEMGEDPGADDGPGTAAAIDGLVSC